MARGESDFEKQMDLTYEEAVRILKEKGYSDEQIRQYDGFSIVYAAAGIRDKEPGRRDKPNDQA